MCRHKQKGTASLKLMAAPRKRRTQAERRAATNEKIMTAARDLFAERGFHGCSLDDILGQAGVSKGGFYRHYEDKVQLFEAVVTALEEEFTIRNTMVVEGQALAVEA